MAKHAIGGGEYTTIDGITYSIAPHGPGTLRYIDKLHTDRPGEFGLPIWRRPVCIICGKTAEFGTRYCRGDRGCPVTHNAEGNQCLSVG